MLAATACSSPGRPSPRRRGKVVLSLERVKLDEGDVAYVNPGLGQALVLVEQGETRARAGGGRAAGAIADDRWQRYLVRDSLSGGRHDPLWPARCHLGPGGDDRLNRPGMAAVLVGRPSLPRGTLTPNRDPLRGYPACRRERGALQARDHMISGIGPAADDVHRG